VDTYLTIKLFQLSPADYDDFHPNLRGYQPSDDGDNLFRVGIAADVLNLITLIQTQSGGTDPLQNANPNLIGLWGHSMGGGLSTRVLTITTMKACLKHFMVRVTSSLSKARFNSSINI
jgi:hypothetical protein